jgi:hypothetical protein
LACHNPAEEASESLVGGFSTFMAIYQHLTHFCRGTFAQRVEIKLSLQRVTSVTSKNTWAR